MILYEIIDWTSMTAPKKKINLKKQVWQHPNIYAQKSHDHTKIFKIFMNSSIKW